MEYKFITLGCKVNSYESAAMGEILDRMGFNHVNEKNTADIIIINTCTVTSVADAKSRQMIRREIKNNPNAIVCAVGCYAQLDAQVLTQIEGVSIIIGTKNRNKIGEYIRQFIENKQQIVEIDENILHYKDFEKLTVTSYGEITRAYLKIQDGCNNFCSYCIIPYARGPLRSRPKKEVLDEAKLLVANGYQEIVLTGIHTAGYGQDLQDYHFADLLLDLCNIDNLKRIRISSIEESEIDDRMLAVLHKCHKIVNHLHIPLQSGCDATLKRMNRKYTTEQYFLKIAQIRALFPDIAITSDVIVGFPGESEEEFRQTKQFITKVKFAALHVFPFSVRQGTPAAYMEKQVDKETKKQRAKELITLSNTLSIHYASLFQDSTLSVLFEEYDSLLKQAKGHTTNYLKVMCENVEQNITNQILSVQILATDFPLNHGIIIENKEAE